MNPPKNIAFIDLAAQQARIRPQIDSAIKAVLDHGQYIMGPEVKRLEQALAEFAGVKHAISCSSGTDGLLLGLMALGLKPDQSVTRGVIVPSFTFAATAEALPCLGAVPIFAEIDAVTFNLDASRLEDALASGQAAGLEVAGIISVGLFGQPSDYAAIGAFAERHGLWVLDDAAQSFGASWGGRAVGHLGAVTATSFFPAKPLGCYGDGGAVFTDDDGLAEKMLSMRVHGMGRQRYRHDYIGMTARLDTLQAAVLLEKLRLFPSELEARAEVAERYATSLSGYVEVPRVAERATSSWAQYVITLPDGVDRDGVQARLKEGGVPTAIYYPLGMHEQKPYSDFPVARGGLGVTEGLCSRVLALPMHPYLGVEVQDYIIEMVRASV